MLGFHGNICHALWRTQCPWKTIRWWMGPLSGSSRVPWLPACCSFLATRWQLILLPTKWWRTLKAENLWRLPLGQCDWGGNALRSYGICNNGCEDANMVQ
jgi:hypothetical protein